MMMLFVLSQTAGVIHTEIHPFHEHEASCDVFDNLGKPFSPNISLACVPQSLTASDAYLDELNAVIYKTHINHFFGRAPPLA